MTAPVDPQTPAPPLDHAPPPVVVYRPCYSHSLFERIMAGIMIGMAFVIAISPTTIAHGGFYLMQDVGLTAPVLAIAFAFIGCARWASLYANGNWPLYGPICRSVGAALGALIWGQMDFALIKWSLAQGYLSIGVVMYTGVIIGELVSCSRARSDGRSR